MSKTDENKKYVTLENVRVSYLKKNDTIHITTTDPDVQAGGFHLTLNKGTQTEETLRDLLSEQGVIRDDVLIPATATDSFASSAGLGFSSKGEGRIITLASSQGGTGKTSVALALAAAVRKTGATAIIVDADIRNGQLSYYVNQATPTMLNYYLSDEKTIHALRKTIIHDNSLDIDVVLSPKRSDRKADLLSSQFYVDMLANLKANYEFVFVDTGITYLDATFPSIVNISDAVLYVADLDRNPLPHLFRWKKELEEDLNGLPDRRFNLNQVGLIANMTLPGQFLGKELIEKYFSEITILAALGTELAVKRASVTTELAEAYKAKNQFNSSIKKVASILTKE
jgi:MinD-like ATPase involved in chromosome partitioning or flagellar assembly